MKLLRVFRHDGADLRIFPAAAEPNEWAVPGTFVFAGVDPGGFTGRQRQAFASGFLGLGSFGWSTLVTIAPIADDDYVAAIELLAEHLTDEYDVVNESEALAAAKAEIDYAAALCDHPAGTLLGIRRFMDGDAIREQFRIVPQP